MTWLNLVQLSKLQQFSQILGQVMFLYTFIASWVARQPYKYQLRMLGSLYLRGLLYSINFYYQISHNDKSWKAWFDSDTPEDSPIPDGYEESLDTFRKLLLIRSWCPDRTVSQARRYIADSIGNKVRICGIGCYINAILILFFKRLVCRRCYPELRSNVGRK